MEQLPNMDEHETYMQLGIPLLETTKLSIPNWSRYVHFPGRDVPPISLNRFIVSGEQVS